MARDRKIAALQAEVTHLQVKVAHLEARLTTLEAHGQVLRAAAPFSKGSPKAHPKTPGRKPGPEHGPAAFRAVPPRIDQVLEARLPEKCPACGGPLKLTGQVQQYQVELPRQVLYRRFDIAVGVCRHCHRRVQGRHGLQTSDALGCCESQLGPVAQATVVWLNKRLGLSCGKVRDLLAMVWGVAMSRGTVAQVLTRAGRRFQEACEQIRTAVRGSAQITSDETGWRVGGRRACLHTAVGKEATLYRVEAHRSVEAIARLIGKRYAGVLVHDGYGGYDWFAWADHQQCLTHLLRRCRELRKEPSAAARRWVAAVRTVLEAALGARDRRVRGKAPLAATQAAAAGLDGRLQTLLARRPRAHAVRRFAKHLARHLGSLWTFLQREGVDATNYRAEQALRPAVVNRKVWGGNRTWAGARAQGVLMSVLTTALQRGHGVVDLLARMLRVRDPRQAAALVLARP